MTGYGRAEKQTDEFLIDIEFKSVNHRYFEFNCKSTKQFVFLQDKLKTLTNQYISRGKVDCLLSVTILQTDAADVLVDESVAQAYVDAFEKISRAFSVPNDISVSKIINQPEVINLKKTDIDEDKISALVIETAKDALERFCEMRKIEGERMGRDVLEKTDNIMECIEYIEKRSPEVVEEYYLKLRERIKEMIDGCEVDDARILQEAAIFSDKTAVDEETVRLRSHINQLRTLCEGKDGTVGKKMDFLLQEINREANTIGSKVSDYNMTEMVITMKSEIEKIREQVQNIE